MMKIKRTQPFEIKDKIISELVDLYMIYVTFDQNETEKAYKIWLLLWSPIF